LTNRASFAGDVSANRALLDQALVKKDLKLQRFYEVQRSSTAIGLVAEDVAAAVVPRLTTQRGADPRIRMIVLTDLVVSRTLVRVTRKTAHLSPTAQALYDMIRERARSTA
jgi:DNA-binding transcriptional LysR family regulator